MQFLFSAVQFLFFFASDQSGALYAHAVLNHSMDGGDFHLRLNSIGESSSGASSPSSVSSSGTDAPRNAVRANRRRLRVRVQSMEGVGGAQRGRRMGRRNNRTRAERATADGVRNARERKRVENINSAYQQLRSELGETRGRPPTKRKTLEMAIQRIRELADELQRLRSEPQYAERPNGNYTTASEPSVSGLVRVHLYHASVRADRQYTY